MIKGLVNNKDLIMTIIVLGVASLLIYLRHDIALSKGNLMKEVCARYNFRVMQINMKASNVILDKYINLEEEESIINDVLKDLGIFGEVTLEKEETEYIKKIDATRNAKNSQTTISIISEKDNIPYTKLKIDISLYSDDFDKEKLQDDINKVFEKYNVSSKLNITFVGTFDGEIDNIRKKEIAKNIMTSMRAKTLEEFENERLYSTYGYTSLIKDEEIIANDNKTNIHIALRYNEYEKKTYLYIASPIISFDY